jgi:hypothetical protein
MFHTLVFIFFSIYIYLHIIHYSVISIPYFTNRTKFYSLTHFRNQSYCQHRVIKQGDGPTPPSFTPSSPIFDLITFSLHVNSYTFLLHWMSSFLLSSPSLTNSQIERLLLFFLHFFIPKYSEQPRKI